MFLVVCGDEVLLEQRSDNNKGFAGELIIPGGKNKLDEVHEDACKRELKEETGLQNRSLVILGKSFDAITTNAHKYRMQAFLIRISNKGEVVNTQPNKGRHVWKSIKNAMNELKWSHSQLVLERLQKVF